MKSNISLEADYSMSHVYFLDTKVKFNAHTSATELYSKSSASFQYLHRTSFHPPHTFRSILKSQLIQIRRICTGINDYWNHSQQFITFFKSRGFHDTILNKICQDIANTPRRNLFRNINGTLSMLCSPQINLTEFPWLPHGIINYLDSNQSFTDAIKK